MSNETYTTTSAWNVNVGDVLLRSEGPSQVRDIRRSPTQVTFRFMDGSRYKVPRTQQVMLVGRETK